MNPENTNKRNIQLTERIFLGYSYFHIFIENETGKEIPIETTKEEYEKLAQSDGSNFIPVLNNATWKYSLGEAIKCDSPNGFLNDKEYVVVDDVAKIALKTKIGSGMSISSNEIISQSINIDADKEVIKN